MEAVLLELMHVVLGAFEAFADQDAFSLAMDLEHMDLGFLSVPAEDHLEDVGDIDHQVHRVVPANHEIARFEGVLALAVGCRVEIRQDHGLDSVSHGVKVPGNRGVFNVLDFREMAATLTSMRREGM